MAEITFKIAVITSSVAKIIFVVDEITFKVVVIILNFSTESKIAARKLSRKCSKLHIFLQIFNEHIFYFIRKPPRSVSFGSETPLQPKSDDQCLICRVVNQCVRF